MLHCWNYSLWTKVSWFMLASAQTKSYKFPHHAADVVLAHIYYSSKVLVNIYIWVLLEMAWLV